MEKTTGKVIYERDAHKKMAPASVTKIMTLLLVMEEIVAGRLSADDIVVCSSHAASMGGSQIWLEEGEQMSVHDMLKAVCGFSKRLRHGARRSYIGLGRELRQQNEHPRRRAWNG